MEYVYGSYKFDNIFDFVFYLFKEYSSDQTLTFSEDLFIKVLGIPSIIILCILGCIALYELAKYSREIYGLWLKGNDHSERTLKYARYYQKRTKLPDEYD